MPVFEKLDEILKDEFKINHQNQVLTLKELHPDNTCKDVELKFNGRLLACKFDEIVRINGSIVDKFPLFKDGRAKEICDYVLFYISPKKPNILYCFIIEMKSGAGGNNQLYAGNILSKYLIDTAKRCVGLQNEFELVKYRGILITNKPSYKPSSVKDIFRSITPDFEYFELLCGEKPHLDAFTF